MLSFKYPMDWEINFTFTKSEPLLQINEKLCYKDKAKNWPKTVLD